MDALSWCDSVEETFSPRERVPSEQVPKGIPETFLAYAIKLVRVLSTEVLSLRRTLACERGDASAAPEGWTFNNMGHWRKDGLKVYRQHNGTWTRSTGRMLDLGEYEGSTHASALEAMLADSP